MLPFLICQISFGILLCLEDPETISRLKKLHTVFHWSTHNNNTTLAVR